MRQVKVKLVVDRPTMPASYGIQPLTTGEMVDWSVVMAKMARQRNYWIGSTCPNGHPHAMPIWGVCVEEVFYFGTGADSRKGRNVVHNSQVVIHAESGDDVLIMEGRVEEVRDASILARYADAYEEKYNFRPDTSTEGSVTYALLPEVAFTWLEQDFPSTAMRWRFSYDS